MGSFWFVGWWFSSQYQSACHVHYLFYLVHFEVEFTTFCRSPESVGIWSAKGLYQSESTASYEGGDFSFCKRELLLGSY